MRLSSATELKATQERIAKLKARGQARLRGQFIIDEAADARLDQFAPKLEVTRAKPLVIMEDLDAVRSPFAEFRVTRRFVVNIEPMGAPRLNRGDKWRNPLRPCVARYWAYRDAIRAVVGDVPEVPDGLLISAFIPMPDSWSASQRARAEGQRHKQKPDWDNIAKGVADALFLEDGAISTGFVEKRWCKPSEARLEIIMAFL